MSATWRVLGLDVWGNETDGFEINDRFYIVTIETPDDPTNAEIWRALLEKSVVKGDMSGMSFNGDDWTVWIDHSETEKPFLLLERAQ